MLDSDVLYENIQPIVYLFIVSVADIIEKEFKLRYLA